MGQEKVTDGLNTLNNKTGEMQKRYWRIA
ncbi:hypothetical protein ACT7DF_08075 [Bacillus cereus]